MVERVSVILMALGISMALPVSAQRLYRCGSTYQDQPCSGEQEGKVIGNIARPETPSITQARVSVECSQRGAAAQRIKWARETGQTQELQESAANSDAERNLIADVYSRQGTSGQVRAAIEANCMADQERTARAAELLRASGLLGGGATQATRSSSDSNSGNVTPEASQDRPQSSSPSCQNLESQLNTVRAKQRAGSTARGMADLSQQSMNLSNRMRALGC
jgi:hypothetical protein